jgi:LemA protein
MGVLIIVILVVAVLAVLVIGIYNSLIKLRNKCEEGWSDIDTQLKRRYDLIPNLVETVKGYASHEKETLEKVTKARTAAMSAQTVHDKEAAENMLAGALKTIFALAERYPDLKANQNFLDLQKTLTEIEEHIQLSRRYYNATVRDFNTKIQVFPNNIVAGMFGFKEREFFQISEEEKENVKVSFQSRSEAEAPPKTKEAKAVEEEKTTDKAEEAKKEE